VEVKRAGDSKLKGVITAIFIRYDQVMYEVSYMNGDSNAIVTCREQELKLESHHKGTSIGFNT